MELGEIFAKLTTFVCFSCSECLCLLIKVHFAAIQSLYPCVFFFLVKSNKRKETYAKFMFFIQYTFNKSIIYAGGIAVFSMVAWLKKQMDILLYYTTGFNQTGFQCNVSLSQLSFSYLSILLYIFVIFSCSSFINSEFGISIIITLRGQWQTKLVLDGIIGESFSYYDVSVVYLALGAKQNHQRRWSIHLLHC